MVGMGKHRRSFRHGRRGSVDETRWRRWLGSLVAGLAIGVLIGFAAGLTRPRATAELDTSDLP